MKTLLTAAAITILFSGAAQAGGFFGNWYFSDGSQSRTSRVVAGAAPNSLATARGVRCSYVYTYVNTAQGRQKVRNEVCN
jgi:hypothetical protein